MWISYFYYFLSWPFLRCCCGRRSIVSQCAFYKAIPKTALFGYSFGWYLLTASLVKASLRLTSCLIIDFWVLKVEWLGYVCRRRSWLVASGVSVFFISPLISWLSSKDPNGPLVCADCLEIAADAAESSHRLYITENMSMDFSGIVIPLAEIRGLSGPWFW